MRNARSKGRLRWEVQGVGPVLQLGRMPKWVLYLIQHIEAPYQCFGTKEPCALRGDIVSSQRVCLFIIMRKCRWRCPATQLKCRVWRLRLCLEHWSHSDNGKKMSLLTFKSPFTRIGSTKLQYMFQPSISACSPHAYIQCCADWTDNDFFSLDGNHWSTCSLITSLVIIYHFSITLHKTCLSFFSIFQSGPL